MGSIKTQLTIEVEYIEARLRFIIIVAMVLVEQSSAGAASINHAIMSCRSAVRVWISAR